MGALGDAQMTIADVEEALREINEMYSEDEAGNVNGPAISNAVYELQLRLERQRLTGVDSVPSAVPPRMFT